MRKLLCFAIATCAVLAGCVGSSDSPPAGGNEEPEEPGPEVPGNTVLMRDCTHDEASHTFPLQSGPGGAPEAWPHRLEAYSDYFFFFIVCQEIDWGPFSRGPVTFVLETHTEMTEPTSCKRGVVSWLASLGIDDEEIAAYAHAEMRLPAYYTEATREAQVANGAGTMSWTWGPEGSRSELLFAIADGPVQESGEGRTRMFYEVDGLPASLDMAFEHEYKRLPYRVAQGTIQEPMLLGTNGDGRFIGTTSHTHDGTIQGSVIYYEDWDCTPKEGGNTTHA